MPAALRLPLPATGLSAGIGCERCLVVLLRFSGDVCRQDRLEPLSGSAAANPRMSSSHRTSEDGGKACGSKCKAVVPSHGGILPPKKKNAMRKIILVSGYAMRRITGMTTSEQYDLHPIECAVIDLEDRSGSKWEAWSATEMKHLKKVCFAKDAPAIGPDLYRAVVAENNGWSYKAGAADCNTVEMFAREWETYKNQ